MVQITIVRYHLPSGMVAENFEATCHLFELICYCWLLKKQQFGYDPDTFCLITTHMVSNKALFKFCVF